MNKKASVNWGVVLAFLIIILFFLVVIIITIFIWDEKNKSEEACIELGGTPNYNFECIKEKNGEYVAYQVQKVNNEYILVRR